MSDKITQLKSQLEGHLKAAEDLAAKAASDTGLTDEDRVTLKGCHEDTRRIISEIDNAKSDTDALASLKSMFADILPTAEEKGDPEAKRGEKSAPARPGKSFTDSEAYAAAKAAGFSHDVKSVDVPQLFKSLARTNSAGDGGNVTQTVRVGDIDDTNWRPRNIRQLADVITSSETSIELLVRVFTNNAAPVGEATATTGASGTAPESGHQWTKRTWTSKVIKHYEPATRKMLNNHAAIQGLIEGDLLNGLEDALEDQAWTGAGTGDNLTGLLNTSGVGAQAFVTSPLVTLLKARTALRIGGRATPTAAALSVEDLETLLLTTDANGNFYFGGPSTLNLLPIVWGMRTAEVEYLTTGTAMVGDFKSAVKLYDVESGRIDWTNSHSDWFTRSIEACRAEAEVILAVQRPEKLVVVDLAA